MTPWIWPDTFREKPLRDFVVDFSAPLKSTLEHDLWTAALWTAAMTPLGLMAAASLENRFRFGFALRNRKQWFIRGGMEA